MIFGVLNDRAVGPSEARRSLKERRLSTLHLQLPGFLRDRGVAHGETRGEAHLVDIPGIDPLGAKRR